MFIGREKELNELQNIYLKPGFWCLLISGVSGVGKTTLLKEFCEGKDAIYFTAEDESSHANLKKFSGLVLGHYGDTLTEDFSTWKALAQYVQKIQSDKGRLIIVLDDFELIANKDPAFLTGFHNIIYNQLFGGQVFLILSSSSIKLVKNFLSDFDPSNNINNLTLEKFLSEDAGEKIQTVMSIAKDEAGCAKMLKVSAGDVIIREGQIKSELYKIISGKALCYFDYETENEHVIGTLKENDIFGEYSVLTGEAEICAVVAHSDMLLLRIGADEFEKFILMNASSSVVIMKNMAKMLKILKLNIDLLREDLQN